jgi:hypothetical protein
LVPAQQCDDAMHEDYDGGVDRRKRAGGIMRVLEKLKYPVFGHICTSDARVGVRGSDGHVKHSSPGPGIIFPIPLSLCR